MAGSERADDVTVDRLRRARHSVTVLLLLSLGVLSPLGSRAHAQERASDAPPDTTTTTATPASTSTTIEASQRSTTTTAPSSRQPPTTATASGPPADAAGAGDQHEPLPPATPGPPPPEEELPPLAPDAPPPVAPPGADDAGRVRAAAELRAAESALKKARATEKALAKKLLPLGRKLSEVKAWMDALDAEDRAAATELADARTKVKRMAVAGYVRGGDSQPVDYLLRSTDPIDLDRRRAIVESATEARHSAVEGYAAARRGTSGRLEQAVDAVETAQAAFDIADAELSSATAITALLANAVEEKGNLLDHANASAIVVGTDIPRLFVDAYRQAANSLGKKSPHCRVPWTAIAAIGKIESNHGRYRGAQFALNGDVYPRILGIPLDGTRSALIRDTDLGAFDSDLEYDRAVGPMQFIPSTWVRINTDGNGDGVSDPNNAYDAALGTASYLCRAVPSGGLDLDEGLRPAFFSYNHSHAYVELVLTWHHTYAGTTPTPPVPAPASAPAP